MNINTNVIKIPSLTWNWLKMNYAKLEVNSKFSPSSDLQISELPEGVTYKENSTGFDEQIPTGLTSEVSTILKNHDIASNSLVIEQNTKVASPIYFNFDNCRDESYTFNSLNVHAKENSEITIIMDFSSDKNAKGLQLIQTKLLTEKNAKIHLITVQILGKNYIHLNDIGCLQKDSSNIKITQIELGAKQAFIGVKSTLQEDNSKFASDTVYFCKDEQLLEFNYVVDHFGKNTNCNMTVSGSLKDNAKKTYRGTIDFKNGCKGATGNESEDTLLLTKTVTNKSIPVILCDEEDVAGEHGATIGKLSKELLFYMQSRGIELKEAEKIIAKAKINKVLDCIENSNITDKIDLFMNEAFND